MLFGMPLTENKIFKHISHLKIETDCNFRGQLEIKVLKVTGMVLADTYQLFLCSYISLYLGSYSIKL